MDTVYNFIEKVRTAIDLRNLIPQAMMYYLNSNPIVNRYLDLSGVSYELERREDSGTVRFLNITFRPDGLEQLGLPVTLVGSYIGSLDLKLPDSYFTTFASLLFGNDGQALDTALVLDSVAITVQPRDNLDGASVQTTDQDKAAASSSRISAADRVSAAMAAAAVNKMRRLGVQDAAEGDVLVLKAVEVLTRQMSLRLHQLHIRYVDTRLRPSQPFAMGLVLQDFIAGPLSCILTKDAQSTGVPPASTAPLSPTAELFASKDWQDMLASLLGGSLPPRLKSFDRKAAAVRGLGLYIQQLAPQHAGSAPQRTQPKSATPLPPDLAFVNASLDAMPVTMQDWVLSPVSAAATYTLQNGQLFNEHCPPAQRLSVHLPSVFLKLDQEQLRSACVVAAYLKNYQMHRRYSQCWLPARRIAEALLLDPLQHTPNEAAWRQAATALDGPGPSSNGAASGAQSPAGNSQRRLRRTTALLHQARRYHRLVAGVFTRILPAELLASVGLERKVYSDLRRLSLDGLASTTLPSAPTTATPEALGSWAAAMCRFLQDVVKLSAASGMSTPYMQPLGPEQRPGAGAASGTSAETASIDSPDFKLPITPGVASSRRRRASIYAAQGTGLMRQFSSGSAAATSPGAEHAVSSILRRQASVRVIDRALLEELSAAESLHDLMAIALANVQLKLRQVMAARQRWLFSIHGVMHDLNSHVQALRRQARSKHFSAAAASGAAAPEPLQGLQQEAAPTQALQDLFVSPVDGVTLGLVDGMWRQNYVAAFKLLYKSYSQLNGILVDSITLPGFSIVEFSAQNQESKRFASHMMSGSSASMKLGIKVTSPQTSSASLLENARHTRQGLPAVCNASLSAFDGQFDASWVADIPAQRIEAFKDSEMLWAPSPVNAAARASAQQIVSFLDRHMSPEYILYFRRLAHNELLLQFYLIQQRSRHEAEIRRVAGLLTSCIPCSLSCRSSAAEEVGLPENETVDKRSRESMARLAAVPLSTGANIRSLAHGTQAISRFPHIKVPVNSSALGFDEKAAELKVRRELNSAGSAHQGASNKGFVTLSTLQLHTPSLDKAALLALLQDERALSPEAAASLDYLLPNWRALMKLPGRTPEALQELNQALRRRDLPTGFAFAIPAPNSTVQYGCIEDLSICSAPFVVAKVTGRGSATSSTFPVSCSPQGLFATGEKGTETPINASVQQSSVVFTCRMHAEGAAASGSLSQTPAVAAPHSREHRGLLPGGELYGAASGPRDVAGWMAESVLALEAWCFDPMLRSRLSRCILCPTQSLTALQAEGDLGGKTLQIQHISFGNFREESMSSAKIVALSSVEMGVPAEHVHGVPCLLRASDKLQLSQMVKVSSLDNTALLDVDDQSLPWSYSLRNAAVTMDGFQIALVEQTEARDTSFRASSRILQARSVDLPVPRGAFFCLDVHQVRIQLRQLKAQHTRVVLRLARLRISQDQRSLVEDADAAFFGSESGEPPSLPNGAAASNPFSDCHEVEGSIAHGPLMTTMDMVGRATDYYVQRQPMASWATEPAYLQKAPVLALPRSAVSSQIRSVVSLLSSKQICASWQAALSILAVWFQQAFDATDTCGELQQHWEALLAEAGVVDQRASSAVTSPTPIEAFCSAAVVRVMTTTCPPHDALLGILQADSTRAADHPATESGGLLKWVRDTADVAWRAAARRFYVLCPSPLQLLHDDEYCNLLDRFSVGGLLNSRHPVALQQALRAWRAAMMLMQGNVWSTEKQRPVSLGSKEQVFVAWKIWLREALGIDSRVHAIEYGSAAPAGSSWWRSTAAAETRPNQGQINTSEFTALGKYLVEEQHALALLLKASETPSDSAQLATTDSGGFAGGRLLAKAICEANGELLSILESILLEQLIPAFVEHCWDPLSSRLRPISTHLRRSCKESLDSHTTPNSREDTRGLSTMEFGKFQQSVHRVANGPELARPPALLCAAIQQGSEQLAAQLQPFQAGCCPALDFYVENAPMPLPAAAFAGSSSRLFAENSELIVQQSIQAASQIESEITVDEVRTSCELLNAAPAAPRLTVDSARADSVHVDVHVGTRSIVGTGHSLAADRLNAFIDSASENCLFAWHHSLGLQSYATKPCAVTAALPSALRSCLLSATRRLCNSDTQVPLLQVRCDGDVCRVASSRVLQFGSSDTARSVALLQSKFAMRAFMQKHRPRPVGAPASLYSDETRNVQLSESSGTCSTDVHHLPLAAEYARTSRSSRDMSPSLALSEAIRVNHGGFIHRPGAASVQHSSVAVDKFNDAVNVSHFTPLSRIVSTQRAKSTESMTRPFSRIQGGVCSLTLSLHPATVGSYLGIFLQMRPFLAAAYIGQLSLLPGSQTDASSLGSSLQLIKHTRQLRRSYQKRISALASSRHSASASHGRPVATTSSRSHAEAQNSRMKQTSATNVSSAAYLLQLKMSHLGIVLPLSCVRGQDGNLVSFLPAAPLFGSKHSSEKSKVPTLPCLQMLDVNAHDIRITSSADAQSPSEHGQLCSIARAEADTKLMTDTTAMQYATKQLDSSESIHVSGFSNLKLVSVPLCHRVGVLLSSCRLFLLENARMFVSTKQTKLKETMTCVDFVLVNVSAGGALDATQILAEWSCLREFVRFVDETSQLLQDNSHDEGASQVQAWEVPQTAAAQSGFEAVVDHSFSLGLLQVDLGQPSVGAVSSTFSNDVILEQLPQSVRLGASSKALVSLEVRSVSFRAQLQSSPSKREVLPINTYSLNSAIRSLHTAISAKLSHFAARAGSLLVFQQSVPEDCTQRDQAIDLNSKTCISPVLVHTEKRCILFCMSVAEEQAGISLQFVTSKRASGADATASAVSKEQKTRPEQHAGHSRRASHVPDLSAAAGVTSGDDSATATPTSSNEDVLAAEAKSVQSIHSHSDLLIDIEIAAFGADISTDTVAVLSCLQSQVDVVLRASRSMKQDPSERFQVMREWVNGKFLVDEASFFDELDFAINSASAATPSVTAIIPVAWEDSLRSGQLRLGSLHATLSHNRKPLATARLKALSLCAQRAGTAETGVILSRASPDDWWQLPSLLSLQAAARRCTLRNDQLSDATLFPAVHRHQQYSTKAGVAFDSLELVLGRPEVFTLSWHQKPDSERNTDPLRRDGQWLPSQLPAGVLAEGSPFYRSTLELTSALGDDLVWSAIASCETLDSDESKNSSRWWSGVPHGVAVITLDGMSGSGFFKQQPTASLVDMFAFVRPEAIAVAPLRALHQEVCTHLVQSATEPCTRPLVTATFEASCGSLSIRAEQDVGVLPWDVASACYKSDAVAPCTGGGQTYEAAHGFAWMYGLASHSQYVVPILKLTSGCEEAEYFGPQAQLVPQARHSDCHIPFRVSFTDINSPQSEEETRAPGASAPGGEAGSEQSRSISIQALHMYANSDPMVVRMLMHVAKLLPEYVKSARVIATADGELVVADDPWTALLRHDSHMAAKLCRLQGSRDTETPTDTLSVNVDGEATLGAEDGAFSEASSTQGPAATDDKPKSAAAKPRTLSITLQTETMIADFDVLATGVQRFWGAPPPASVMKVAHDFHAELLRGASSGSGESSPYTPEARKCFPNLLNNFHWTSSSDVNRLQWLHEVARGAVAPHCHLVQYSASVGICVDAGQVHEMWLTSAEHQRAQMQLNELHVATGAMFLAYVAPSPLLSNVSGIPQGAGAGRTPNCPCVWAACGDTPSTNSSAGVRAPALRGAPMSARWAAASGMQRLASMPAPTRYVVHPQWWIPGSPLPQHAYSYNAPPWIGSVFTSIRPFNRWAKDWLAHSASGTVDELQAIQASDMSASDQLSAVAAFTDRRVQLRASMAHYSAIPELAELLAQNNGDIIREIAHGKRQTDRRSDASAHEDGVLGEDVRFIASDAICEAAFLGVCIAGHTETLFRDPPEAAPLQNMPTASSAGYPLASWVASQLLHQASKEASARTSVWPVSACPLLPNTLHLTMVLPMNPYDSNLVPASRTHIKDTHVFPPRFAEWIVEWMAHLQSRLGVHGGYGPLWVWSQESTAQHSAPSQYGVPNWNSPELLNTEDVSEVMHHMAELRSAQGTQQMMSSPLCSGDPRGKPVPPPPRTHVNFTDVSHVRVAMAGLTVRFTRMWQDELKAGVSQLLAAQKGRNLWMASCTVAPTAGWMKLAVSARDICVVLPWCMTDPSCELAVTIGSMAVSNHMERSQPVVRASARYPQYFDEQTQQHSAQRDGERAVRVIMTDPEALSAPVLSEVFDVAASGLLAELHTLSRASSEDAFSVGVQPIMIASSIFVAAASPVSMAERFAGAVDASLDLRMIGSGGGSFMQSALKDILRIVAANFREQSCLLHVLPILDARMMDKHMQILMPGDESAMPVAQVAAPQRSIMLAVPGTHRGASQYTGQVQLDMNADSTQVQRYPCAVGLPLEPTTTNGGSLHLLESAVLDYHPFSSQHVSYMSPSAVVPLAALQSFHAQPDHPLSASRSLPSTGRMGPFLTAFEGVRAGAQLGSGVQIDISARNKHGYRGARSDMGMFRFVQQERRIDLSSPLRQFDRPYPEEHEWVWLSKQLAADKLQLKRAMEAHGYTSAFRGTPPQVLPAPERTLREPMFQATPTRTHAPEAPPPPQASPAASGGGSQQHWSGSEQFPDLMPDSASAVFRAGDDTEYTPPDMRPHMLALLRAVAAPDKRDQVTLEGVDCSPASVMDTASLILQRSIQTVQAEGVSAARLVQQLQAVQAATEAATEALAEAAAAAEEAAVELSVNNEMMASMLANQLAK